MTTQSALPQAIFPDLPRSRPEVNNGSFNDDWSLGFSLLFQALQKNFSNEGILFPPLSATELSTIAALYTAYINQPLPQNTSGGTQKMLPDISGATVFDTTNRISKQFVITYDASTPPKVASAQWMMLSLITTYPGDPNGNVGGALNWFCIDTANSEIFVCTTAGSANGTPAPQAVWSPIVSGGAFLLL